MNIKCSKCGMVNWTTAETCKRCGALLTNDIPQVTGGQSSRARNRTVEEKAQIRQSGLKKIKYGAVVSLLFVIALIAIPLMGYRFSFGGGIVLVLTPVAWLLAGVLQIVTGTPFEELSERWDNLAWWQRGLIGTSVFVGGLFLVLAVAVVVIRIFFW